MKKNKLLVVDGNSLLFRAYYASAYSYNGLSNLKTTTGVPTNAILAFNRMLINIINKLKPTHILIAFDAAKKNKRHELYSDYKAGRSETPHDLIPQFKIVREMLDCMNIKWFELEGWEADDIIATSSKKFNDKNTEIKILSSDKDLLQLVTTNVSFISTKSGAVKLEEINFDNFKEKLNLHPNQIVDFKGLAGDPSDNLPGITGVGEKTATKLLSDFESLNRLYDNLDKLSPKLQERLTNGKKMAMLCRELAILKTDLDLPFLTKDLLWSQTISKKLLKFYFKYELLSLFKRDRDDFSHPLDTISNMIV